MDSEGQGIILGEQKKGQYVGSKTSKEVPYYGESDVCALHFLSPVLSDFFGLVRTCRQFDRITV